MPAQAIAATFSARARARSSPQGYETKKSAHKGIESVKTSAPDAKLVDLTEREPAHN
jgi:uncharacterized protein